MEKSDSLHVEILIFKVEESPIIKKGLTSISQNKTPKLKQQQTQESEAQEIAIMILDKLTAAK